ncbi:MAG: BatD family protein [Bacteroidales bacterium]|nr:BatD family protein [Bacteroidales bacterium]
MAKNLILCIFIFIASAAIADDVQFVMSAPNAVEMGKQFSLSFSLNNRGTNLNLPAGLTDNFNVLMGPSTNQSTSIEMINGSVTTQISFSYTYIIQAKNEGNFEIRPASIEVDGEIYESNSINIQVVKAQGQSAQQSVIQGNMPEGNAGTVSISKENLFVMVELSKSNVFRGEQLIATVKLYADPNIPVAGFEEVNLPTYEGFYTQDIEIPQQIVFNREVYNNKIYQVGLLKKTILFPQQNGRITIASGNMTLSIQERVRQRSFFDDFFSGYRTSFAKVSSEPVSVNVKDLPGAPDGFKGGVGSFDVTSEISSTNVTANNAITLTLKINGSGNIRLIQPPELNLPSDFDIYDPKITDNVNATNNGLSGTKIVEYLFQPRFEGDYTIPGLKFVYFNPATNSYITKTTRDFAINVEKGSDEQSSAVVSVRKENIQLIGQDIRFIKQGNPAFIKKGYTFYGSTAFYMVYIISAVLFIVILIIYKKKARENANIVLMRNKKASKIAKNRLKVAAKFMKQNNNEAFHESVLKAFWGYLSDKLGIPVADLNRDFAVQSLLNKNVEQNIINRFIEVVEQCEFARYAPVQRAEVISELYGKAESTMSDLEKQIKR